MGVLSLTLLKLHIYVLFELIFLTTVAYGLEPIINVEIPATARLRSSIPASPLDRNLVSWSIQGRDFPAFAQTDLLKNFFSVLSAKVGTGQILRLGGAESDKTTYSQYTNITAKQFQSGYYGPNWRNVTLGPNYFKSFKGRYATGTKFIWCLNLRDTTNQFEAAISTAGAVLEHFGDELEYFEIGNEVDFYRTKGYRDTDWSAEKMFPQWTYIADKVQEINPSKNIHFTAGGFANAAIDVSGDFDVPGVIKAGFKGARIPWYNMHLYPQSGCGGRPVSMANLLNHDTLFSNVTSYIPQVLAAEAVGAQFVIGESNSVSCSGRPGVSDTFAAALWMVDYALLSASIGIRRVFFHTTTKAPYSAIIPKNYRKDASKYSAGFLPLAYGAYFVSEIIASNDNLLVQPIDGSSGTDYSSYSLWDESNNLRKIVFINLEIYNSTTGATSAATDNSPVYVSNAPRGSTRVNISTPWAAGEQLSLIRLQAPGSNSKSMVNVSDFTFSNTNGLPNRNVLDEIIKVQDGGLVVFDILASEAVLVQHYREASQNPHPTSTIPPFSTSTGDQVASTTSTKGPTSNSSRLVCSPFMVISILLFWSLLL
ncbi:hypothetical protein H072_5843 [Dactylellina haptotyla CBS 200.50]|uniref:Beta-glucuronidase C-terminal domain-containing protein n=1 Tax=Dactylellina haptotyla (strain CBS 200.50) TaxID=1284197 RepID=S8BLR4_DACHA|nr:hypothetical protein H072_5843 [Dactylellina haptotyla CBS 200.50]